MATDKLTDRQIKSASFEKYGKRTKLSDGAGMYLYIQPSGKYWRMKYRFGGKEKTLALGVYPDVPLKLVRIPAHHEHPFRTNVNTSSGST